MYTHNHTERVQLFHCTISSCNVSHHITSLVKRTENLEGGKNSPYRCRRRDRKRRRSFIPPWRMRGHTSRKNVERGESSGNGHHEGSMRVVGVLELPVWNEYLPIFIFIVRLEYGTWNKKIICTKIKTPLSPYTVKLTSRISTQ